MQVRGGLCFIKLWLAGSPILKTLTLSLKLERERMLKVLIAVDGSDHSNRAIQAVANMANSSVDLTAVLFCVSPEPSFYSNYAPLTKARVEEDQRKQQETILVRAAENVASLGIRLGESFRAHGVVADEIVRVAFQEKVDQIAMGTQGMGALGTAFLGSVVQKVIHQSPVHVLLAK
jgi:nucleotide-binding universal stress UspA family protein